MLVGRETERAAIAEVLEDARRGRTRVLVLTGEAGIGKSALLAHAREQGALTGMRTLSTVGVESELDLPFAALHALLLPVLDRLDEIPERQAQALGTALALGGTEQADRLGAYAGTLSLLAGLAADQPLVLLVDDAHWIDRASAEALGFAARRIAGEEIAMLVAIREGERSNFDRDTLPEFRLGPLTDEQSLALLDARHGPALDRRVARTIADFSDGNPLALVELPAALSDTQLAGRGLIDSPLPVAERIQLEFLRRVEGIGAPTRRALVVAAAGADAPLSAVRQAAEAVGGGALEPAEEEGLVDLGGGSARFRHPLLRSAVYQGAAPAERRAAHGALADVLEGDQSAWHAAAAAEGPDEKVAVALEAAAERAVLRGGYATQASALVRAAELSEDDESRARRFHSACRAAYWAGLVDDAVRLAKKALPLTRDPLIRADLHHQLAVIGDFHASLRTEAPSSAALEAEAGAIQDADPERAIALLGVILQRRRMRLEPAAAVEVAQRRLELAEGLGGERETRSKQDLVQALCLAGRSQEAEALQDEVLETRAREQRLPTYASQAAEPLLWLERHDELRELLARSIERSREEGNLLRLAFDLTNLGSLELRTARLDAAEAAASEALGLTKHIEMDYLQACNHATLAGIAARRGRTDECRRRAESASSFARDLGEELLLAEGRIALGLLALSEGALDDAIHALEPVSRLARRNAIDEPAVLPCAADLVEAYARAGRQLDAEEELERLGELGERTERRSALSAADRCRGLLAPDGEFAAHFERSTAVSAPPSNAPAPSWRSAKGSAAPIGAGTPAPTCAARSRASTRSAPRPGRSALEPSCAPPARPWTGESLGVRGTS